MSALFDDSRALAALLALSTGDTRPILQYRTILTDTEVGRAWALCFDAHLHACGLSDTKPPSLDTLSQLGARATLPVVLAALQASLRATLAFDRSQAVQAYAVAQRFASSALREDVQLRLRLGAHWLSASTSHANPDALATLEHEALAAGLADVVVDAAALRALALVESGNLEHALEHARRASRMARTESLPQQEYLANIVLARVRRLSGRPYLAAHILEALSRFASPMWRRWVHWEHVLAAGASIEAPADAPSRAIASMVAAATAGDREQLVRAAELATELTSSITFAQQDALRARAALDVDFDTPLSEMLLNDWRAGATDDPPFGVLGLASGVGNDRPRAHVLVGPKRLGRRALRLGATPVVPCDVDLKPLQRRESRTDAVLAVLALAGKHGEQEATLFAKVWGFPFEPTRHQDVLNMALSRARARLVGCGKLQRASSSLVLVPELTLSIPDPRGSSPADDRLLWFLARHAGASAAQTATALGVPLRTVQGSLKALVDEGLCASRRQGRGAEYYVEDTTFQEPTRPGLR
ncbi:MAG: helix-turn-helix domain-containing protein [Polyangiaceae bacterium]